MSKTPETCPGISQFMRPTPSFIKCPKCNGAVEIWSDEDEAECPTCRIMISKDKTQTCLDYCEFADKCKDMIEAKKKREQEQ